MLNIAECNRFGIEIETVGLEQPALARAVCSAIPGSRIVNLTQVTMADGRIWNVVRDASLSGGHRSGEVVSPILTPADLDLLQDIVRALRAAGARTDSSCGIHIHVDGSRFDVRGVLNLVNIVCKNERLIEKALGVSSARLAHYTKALDLNFLARLDEARIRTMQDLQTAWYARHGAPSRYDHTRYHGLNLNSLFYRGTVEFRYFDGTLHAGEVKSYVQLCLALVQRAQNIKSSSRGRRVVEQKHSRWAFRVLLKTLGMVGPEYKTARLHLTKNLEGTSANPGRRRAAEPTPESNDPT